LTYIKYFKTRFSQDEGNKLENKDNGFEKIKNYQIKRIKDIMKKKECKILK